MNNGSVKGFQRRRYAIVFNNRHLEPISNRNKPSVVDKMNQQARLEAYKKKAKLISEGKEQQANRVRFKELHPTKGYRNIAA